MGSISGQKFLIRAINNALKQLVPTLFLSQAEKDNLSTLGIKYPTLRDHPLHNSKTWMAGKRADDNTNGLWRIHDNLYDFSNFIDIHPGGKDWLNLTKGTDITEAFETHHLSSLPETMLSEYFVAKATHPRNSPFTFKQGDFYHTLKKNVYQKLQTLPKKSVQKSKYITDMLFITYIVSALLSVYLKSFTIGALAGVTLSMTATAAHNYLHQRDSFRMYYFDFTLMFSREWRVSHALSHHMYTNTINDLEVSIPEPFLQFLPTEKNFIFRHISWMYAPVVYAVIYLICFVKTFIQLVTTWEDFNWAIFLPFTVPISMYLVTKESPWYCAGMFLWIILTSGLHFLLIGFNAGHHHPDVFHDGDTPRPKDEMDWGVYQLDAVMDRKDITGSHFLVLTSFGDHALHHLFPTIDHGMLDHLYPVFLDTCEKFGLEWRLSTQLEVAKGTYKQLAKVEPNRSPPKRMKKVKKNS